MMDGRLRREVDRCLRMGLRIIGWMGISLLETLFPRRRRWEWRGLEYGIPYWDIGEEYLDRVRLSNMSLFSLYGRVGGLRTLLFTLFKWTVSSIRGINSYRTGEWIL